LITCAWIETSSAETGSSHTISFGSTASAARSRSLALAAGNSCVAAHVIGLQADSLEQLHDALVKAALNEQADGW